MGLHKLFYENLDTLRYISSGGYSSKARILRLISEGDTSEIYPAAEEYIGGLLELYKDLSLSEIKECTTYVFAQVSAVATNAGLDDWEAKRIKEGYYLSIDKTDTPEGLAELAREFIIDFAHAVDRQMRFPSYSPLIQNIIVFVNENLEKKITINMLAERFYCSESYISHQFRAEMGQSIMEYTTQRKIIMSKVLIRQCIPLSQVAQQMGFSSQSHFTKAFKKVTGKTPARWKTEAGKGNSLQFSDIR